MPETDEYQLHHIARSGDHVTLETVLKSGQYDVNKGNYDLTRPLHEACLRGHYGCSEMLCNFGANVNLRNIDGATALCDACSKGSLECIKLLLHRGALVNVPFLFITPLHEAVLGNNWHCIGILLRHGAILEASDLDYGTPLQMAVNKGFLESAKILLQAGAAVNASKNHQTPLHTAAKAGDWDMIDLLLEYGADVYLCDGRGRMAAQLVSADGTECLELLKKQENIPKSLRQVCRLKIRKLVGASRLDCLSCLMLPGMVTRFLEFT